MQQSTEAAFPFGRCFLPHQHRAIQNLAEIIKAAEAEAEAEEAGDYILLMHTKQLMSKLYWRKWATSSHPLRFKQTTPWPKVLSTVVSNPSAQKPWICDSIGYKTGPIENKSEILLEASSTQSHDRNIALRGYV